MTFSTFMQIAVGGMPIALRQGVGDFVPPAGFVFLVDAAGNYLVDSAGYYLLEAA